MGKVYRQDKKSVQRIRARDIVPGDIVEVAGEIPVFLNAVESSEMFLALGGGEGGQQQPLGLWVSHL